MKNIPKLKWVGSIHEGIQVATDNLDTCIKFYTEVLGLKLLVRPEALDKFGPGAWLGDDDDTVQFHLIANDNTLIPEKGAKIEPAGRHTALEIKDIGTLRDRLNALKIEYEETFSLLGRSQVFVLDPQGHTWEFQGSSN